MISFNRLCGTRPSMQSTSTIIPIMGLKSDIQISTGGKGTCASCWTAYLHQLYVTSFEYIESRVHVRQLILPGLGVLFFWHCHLIGVIGRMTYSTRSQLPLRVEGSTGFKQHMVKDTPFLSQTRFSSTEWMQKTQLK